MKHLLNGVAFAAALAIIAPAWAQNAPPAAPAAPAAPSAPAPAAAPAKPMSGMSDMKSDMKMAKKPMKRHVRHMARKTNVGTSMTEELNRQELARITGGGAAPMAAPAASPSFGSMPAAGQGQQPGK